MLWKCCLFIERLPVVYACDELGRRERCTLFLHTSLQGLPCRQGPFSHHLSVSEAVTLHINGPNGLTTGTNSPLSFSPYSLYYSVYIFFLSFLFPVCICLSASFFFFPFGSAVHKSLSYHSDVLWPCWGDLRCDLSSSWFSCRMILCMSVLLSVTQNSDTASYAHGSELFILFSCQRMELSRCITDCSFAGQAHCFPWLLRLKSVETGLFLMPINGLFSWIHEGTLGFWMVWQDGALYAVRSPRFVLNIHTLSHVGADMLWWVCCIQNAMAVIKITCQIVWEGLVNCFLSLRDDEEKIQTNSAYS